MQVRCSGQLFITDKNSCFNADKLRFAILHKDVKSITKLQGEAVSLAGRGPLSSISCLYLVQKSPQSSPQNSTPLLSPLTSAHMTRLLDEFPYVSVDLKERLRLWGPECLFLEIQQPVFPKEHRRAIIK
jgi:hypothetical protein